MNIQFQFDSLNEFLSMSGHGPFVWACYLIALLLLVALAIGPLFHRRRFMQVQKRLLRIEQGRVEQENLNRNLDSNNEASA